MSALPATASGTGRRSTRARRWAPVRLTVSDIDRSREFYERAVGLRATELEDGRIASALPAGRRWSSFAATPPRRHSTGARRGCSTWRS